MMLTINPDKIIDAYDTHEYKYFVNSYDLNIGAVRSNNLSSNRFNDYMFVLWHDPDGMRQCVIVCCTTDPGQYYRDEPMRMEGTALMVPGQYRGAYTMGHHKGIPAFVQIGKMNFWRLQPHEWNNLVQFKLLNEHPESFPAHETSIISANIHRASRLRVSTQIDKWSAGCQVVPDAGYLDFMIHLAHRQIEYGHGSNFSYTLFTENQIV